MKTITTKKLFAFIIMMMFSFTAANAQIVYTDVNPDITKNTNAANYKIDLNNDGIKDFKIYVSINAATGQCTGHTNYSVSVTPLNTNSVAYITPPPRALKLSANTIIDQNTNWSSFLSRILRKAQTWTLNSNDDCRAVAPSGDWSTSSDGYIGLKLNSAGNVYYGWARLSVTVTSTTASFTIKDYAYDSTPNHSILAGATNGALLRAANLTNVIYNLTNFQIAPNPLSNSTTISFSLTKSQKVSLRIFDLNGRLVTTLADKMFEEGENEIIWNAAEANTGIYFLRMETANYSENRKLIVAK